MTTLRCSFAVLPVLASLALLAACATGGATGGTGGGTDSGGSSGGDASAGDCSVFDDTEAAPFTSASVLEAPESGAVWGDNLASFSFTVSPDVAEQVPQLNFLKFADGALQDGASGVLIDQGAGVFSTESSLFDSDLDSKPGIAQLFVITDTPIEGAQTNGGMQILGNYCVTFKVAP
jgi:hypothetical protein